MTDDDVQRLVSELTAAFVADGRTIFSAHHTVQALIDRHLLDGHDAVLAAAREPHPKGIEAYATSARIIVVERRIYHAGFIGEARVTANGAMLAISAPMTADRQRSLFSRIMWGSGSITNHGSVTSTQLTLGRDTPTGPLPIQQQVDQGAIDRARRFAETVDPFLDHTR